MVINRPYHRYYKQYTGSEYNYSGTQDDRMTDQRPPLVKTPRTKWRPPTSYYRIIETGYVKRYHEVSRETYNIFGGNEILEYAGPYPSGSYGSAAPSVPVTVKNWCTNRALRKLKGQEVNLAQAFGERRQTARLVGDNLARIAKSFRALKRLDTGAALHALGLKRSRTGRLRPEGVTDMWLELQYGWKPLLSDIHGSVERLHQTVIDRDNWTFSAKAKRTEKAVIEVPLGRRGVHYGNGGPYYYATEIREETYQAFIRLDYVRQDEFAPTLLTDLGLTNPLSLAWELLPFSFVVDWTVPLGEYFSLIDANFGWDFRGGSMSTRAYRKLYPRLDSIEGRSSTYKNREASVTLTGVGEQMRFAREVIPTSPAPIPPSIDWGASNLHVANGLALISSAFLGKKSRVR